MSIQPVYNQEEPDKKKEEVSLEILEKRVEKLEEQMKEVSSITHPLTPIM